MEPKLTVKGVGYGKKYNETQHSVVPPKVPPKVKKINPTSQPNYLNPTISSNAQRSIRARYLERKKEEKTQEEVEEVQKETKNLSVTEQLAECRKQLEEYKWKLREMEGELGPIAERSDLTPKKVSKVEASLTGETQDSAKDLQQWYTINELADECMEKFKTHCSDVWENENVYYVEPSAGEGDILLKLPEGRRKGVDLEPKNDKLEKMEGVTDRIEKMNFFDTTRENLGVKPDQPLVLIGNPPFGDVASHFFDHATTKGLQGKMRSENYKGALNADYIAWILPNSFLSRGKRNKIDPLYHLIYVMNITCCYVHKGKLYNLATMFGIWKREDIPLLIPQTIFGNSDFELITSKEEKKKNKG